MAMLIKDLGACTWLHAGLGAGKRSESSLQPPRFADDAQKRHPGPTFKSAQPIKSSSFCVSSLSPRKPARQTAGPSVGSRDGSSTARESAGSMLPRVLAPAKSLPKIIRALVPAPKAATPPGHPASSASPLQPHSPAPKVDTARAASTPSDLVQVAPARAQRSAPTTAPTAEPLNVRLSPEHDASVILTTGELISSPQQSFSVHHDEVKGATESKRELKAISRKSTFAILAVQGMVIKS